MTMDEWVNSLDPNLISIILPTYNRPKFLKSSLDNICNVVKSNFEIEVIIIDDGSTINNIDVISAYAHLLDIFFIRLNHNSKTVCIPRNIGISWASGRIIAPTDDDCLVTPNKFSSLFSKLNEDPANIMAYGNREVYHVDSNGDFHLSEIVRCPRYQNKQFQTALGIDNGQFIYRADVYKSINPVFSINACDWHTYSSFAHLGNFGYVDESVCQYLWHGKNTSLTGAPNRQKPFSIIQHYLKYFKEGPYLDKCRSILNP